MVLDDVKTVNKLDTEDMYHKIIHLPEQILNAYEMAEICNANNIKKSGKIRKIVVCGMGGSAISGDMAVSCFPELPIHVVKDYHIPHLDGQTLVIVLSYSGNTEESISCAHQALKTTPYLAAVTSGGKLANMLSDDNLWVKLKAGLPPRSAIGYLFFSLVKILENYSLIPTQSEASKQTVANLICKANAITINQPFEMNFAKQSAEQLVNKIPVIYACEPYLSPLAYRWKCQINENAKYPAFYHTFPEMNHNEIEGWEAVGSSRLFMPVFLSSLQPKEQYGKRVKAFKKLLDKSGIKYLEFFTEGDSPIEQLFSLIYLGDMVSFYLAILNKVNPTTISFIDFLKQEIS